MSRNIPGTIEVEGREFFYIETSDGAGFRKLIDAALTGSPDVPLPNDGGVIEEKVRILLEGGTTLLGISYKGDLPGWRAKLLAYCKANHRTWGIASRQKLALSDGTELALCECEAVFEP